MMSTPLSRWRQALPATVLLLGAMLLLYRDTAAAMVAMWSYSDTFAHGFLVPPIVLWLIWRQRAALAPLVPRPQPWVLLPIAGLALVWLLGELVAMNAMTQLAMTGIVVLLVPALLGFEVARVMMFPLGFLFFAVPIGEFMTPTMIDWTAWFTIRALQLSGIPVHVEGNHLTVPSGRWAVVEACSGVRYLIASFMVGTLFAYLNYRSMRRRWLFVGVSILVPIVANWLRAYLIVMVGHLSDNRFAAGADHLVYGWLFFGIVIAIMFAVGSRWAEPDEPIVQAVGQPSVQQTGSLGHPRLSGWSIAAAAAMIVLLPHLVLRAVVAQESQVRPALSLPVSFDMGWQASTGPLWKPLFLNPRTEANAAYSHGQQPVGLYVAYYRSQGYDSKLVSAENKLVRADDWNWVRTAVGTPRVDLKDRTLELRSGLFMGFADGGQPGRLDRTGQYLLAWQIYWIDGRWTSNDPWAKVVGAMSRLSGRGDDGAAVVVYAVGEDPARLAQDLEDFTRASWKDLNASLRRTSELR